jgi:hypothetical protein
VKDLSGISPWSQRSPSCTKILHFTQNNRQHSKYHGNYQDRLSIIRLNLEKDITFFGDYWLFSPLGGVMSRRFIGPLPRECLLPGESAFSGGYQESAERNKICAGGFPKKPAPMHVAASKCLLDEIDFLQFRDVVLPHPIGLGAYAANCSHNGDQNQGEHDSIFHGGCRFVVVEKLEKAAHDYNPPGSAGLPVRKTKLSLFKRILRGGNIK